MAWFRPDGAEMSDEDWDSGYAKSVGVFMNGQSIQATDPYGGRVVDDTFLDTARAMQEQKEEKVHGRVPEEMHQEIRTLPDNPRIVAELNGQLSEAFSRLHPGLQPLQVLQGRCSASRETHVFNGPHCLLGFSLEAAVSEE